jgi:hypothetical protein
LTSRSDGTTLGARLGHQRLQEALGSMPMASAA